MVPHSIQSKLNDTLVQARVLRMKLLNSFEQVRIGSMSVDEAALIQGEVKAINKVVLSLLKKEVDLIKVKMGRRKR